MKRLSPTQRLWFAARARAGSRTRRKVVLTGYLFSDEGRRLVRLHRYNALPSNLCLDENCGQTLAFFHDLRLRTTRKTTGQRESTKRRSRLGWVRQYTDFTTLRRVSPGAALILAAEYDRMLRVSRQAASAVDLDRWDEQVYATLHRLGFFNLLGFSKEAMDPRRALPDPVDQPGFFIVPMQCGDDTDMTKAGTALLDLFSGTTGDNRLRVALFGAVVDAVENVRGHAYKGQSPARQRVIPPLWWLGGSADHVNRKVTLFIYDQGLTIPVTLPNRWSLGVISDMFQGLFSTSFDPTDEGHDDRALQVAMRLSETSTGQAERGKGLSRIMEVVVQSPGGSLRVISRRGNFSYRNGVETVSTLPVALLGTYLEIEATF